MSNDADRRRRRIAILVACVVFGLTCLPGGLGSLGIKAWLCFIGTTAFYLLLVRTNFLNEIEGAVAFEILLINALFALHLLKNG